MSKNSKLILINTLNSIGDKYCYYYESNLKDVEANLKLEINNVLMQNPDFDLRELNQKTRILLEYLFSQHQEMDSLIEDLTPFPEIAHTTKNIHNYNRECNVLSRIMFLGRFDLLEHNYKYVLDNIFYEKFDVDFFIKIKKDYPQLYLYLMGDSMNFILKTFFWENSFANSEIEEDVINSINQKHVDYIMNVGNFDGGLEKRKQALIKIKERRPDLNTKRSLVCFFKFWIQPLNYKYPPLEYNLNTIK